jgi:cation diffusion facilitator family transporter
MNDNRQRYNQSKRVSFVTICINIALTVFKAAVGIISGSFSILSDAIHSLSDVLSTLIVMIGLKLSIKQPDKEHNYGHDKIEAIVSKILALILFGTGIYLGYEAIDAIVKNVYKPLSMGALMLAVTAVSIAACEFMYRYKMYYAKKLRYPSLKADAWHHRSDAISSIAVLIGVGGYLSGVYVLEPIATLVVALLIVKVAIEIYIEGEKSMLDQAASPDIVEKIKEIITREGVKSIDELKTRISGSKLFVDIEISLDKNLSLLEAHDTAEKIHRNLENAEFDILHATVHVNPYTEPAGATPADAVGATTKEVAEAETANETDKNKN